MRSLSAAVTLGVLISASGARADAPAPPPTLRGNELSEYERQEIDDALFKLDLVREEHPEGKTLEGIDVVPLDVIEDRDPAPSFLNVFHATTRRFVVDREILVRPGEAFRQVLVDESVRNLRAKVQLSLVVAVAVRGSSESAVRLLVITKDVWSLRLNSSFQVGNGGLEDLILQPSEINFLGTHQQASLLFELDPATLTLGAMYREPRVGGTRTVLTASADVIVNRASGRPEGSYGQLLAYQPLYSGRTEWGWTSSVQWDQEIERRFVNAQESLFKTLPWEYSIRRYVAQESLTRSFGWDTKHDFSLGATADLRRYLPSADDHLYDPALVSAFVSEWVPRSDKRIGPFVEYHGYQNRFLRVHDFQTLALQEDYRLGPEAYVRVYPIARAFGSSRDVLGVYASAQYSAPFLGDGLVRAQVETLTEAEVDRVADAYVAGGGQLASPQLPIGRFVYDAHAVSRWRNYLNADLLLGGDTRLRGYPSSYFVGKDLVASNLEFRTRPLEILRTLELGAAVFYDAGDAFNGYDHLSLKHAVGVGGRFLFPQLDRYVLRVDVGFPIGAGASLPGVPPVSYFMAFQQAFSVPTLSAVALPSGP